MASVALGEGDRAAIAAMPFVHKDFCERVLCAQKREEDGAVSLRSRMLLSGSPHLFFSDGGVHVVGCEGSCFKPFFNSF